MDHRILRRAASSRVKTACAALSCEILNAAFDIEISNELKALILDPSYCKGVAAMENLFMTISFCLMWSEGDEATFPAVYAGFVAIKYHIKTLNRTVMDALLLNDNDIDHMTTLINQRFVTIFSESHCLTFVTDPLFSKMRVSIAAKFGEQFLQLRRASFKEHSNAAISRLLNSDENLSRSMLSELAPFIMRHKEQMKTTSVILSSNFGILDVI